MKVLGQLAAELRAEGGPLADELDRDGRTTNWDKAGPDPDPDPDPGLGAIAAAGPRAAASRAEYERLVETIYEGYRQHYGSPRLMRGADADLRLLAGDRLYAIGLERLVALGDVAAVVELADVISLCALAHARGCGELAGPLWTAGAKAVGWGASPAYAEAKSLLMAGDERGGAALRTVAGASPTPPGELGR